MTVIRQDDLIDSVADALQFISYYHPLDFIQAVHEAYQREESPAAKDAMAQILINSRMAAMGHGRFAKTRVLSLCLSKLAWTSPGLGPVCRLPI